MFGALFYTRNLYVPLYLIVIKSDDLMYTPREVILSDSTLSETSFNKPIIVSNNFRGL